MEISEKLVGQTFLSVRNIEVEEKATDRNVCSTKYKIFLEASNEERK